MISISTLFSISCFIVSAFLMIKFKRFLVPRKNGETLNDFIARAYHEHQKDKQAVATMFGSKKSNIIANIVNFLFLSISVYLLTNFKSSLIFLLIYIGIGFFVSWRTASTLKPSEYHRLSIGDRLWFRLFFAILWPLGKLAR